MVSNHPALREVENFEDNKTQRGEESFESTRLKLCLPARLSPINIFQNMYLKIYHGMKRMDC